MICLEPFFLIHCWQLGTIEPRVDVPASLEPFEGLEISQSICPLDIRLSIDQLVEVMKRYRHAKHVLVPRSATASTLADGTAELSDAKATTSTSAIRWSSYKVGESIQLGMGSLYETVLLSEEVTCIPRIWSALPPYLSVLTDIFLLCLLLIARQRNLSPGIW